MEKVDASEEILKEICYSNGMKYSKLNQEGLSCLSLEMYFTGFTRFIEMNNFPNLQHLCIVGQPLERIENLSSLNKLLELWIVECEIKEIVGLDSCLSLRRLYLYSNKISKIENLDTLTCLKVLHLNNNQIRTVQGLDMLVDLEELNLAENLIDCIGSSMKNLVNLVTLELSGNPLFCLQDLRNLVHLNKLVSLSLKSCLYKSCPVTNLSNYSSFMVYHFPQLKNLDEENIGQLGVKATAELVVEKKMRFYRMKKHAIHSNLFQVFQRVEEGYLEKVKPLLRLISHIEANLLIKNAIYELSNTTMVKDLTRCYRRIERYTEEKKNLMKECNEHACMQQCFLQIELESAGNVTVTIGSPSYPWFQPCLKLVQSRFCGSDCPRGLGSEIFITQIARIENSMVLDRFHFYVNSELHQEEANYWPASRTNYSKKNVDYLFHVWKEGMQLDEELVEILSYGMKGHNCHLSNSIQIANEAKLPSKRGKLILCRVFLGRSAPYEGSQWPTIDSFPNDLDSLYQAKQSLHESSMELIRDPTLSTSPLLVSLCNCADKQMHWFVKEANFICPEYIVDFEYHSKSGLPDKLEDRLQQFTLPLLDKINQFDELRQPCDKGINDLFKPGVELSTSVIELDLSKEGLSRLEGIGAFRALMRLVVSHNAIASLRGLSSLASLQELDASHNHICDLHSLNVMFCLKILNLSFNLLHSPYSDLLTLKYKTPNLTQLNLSFNPYKKISIKISFNRIICFNKIRLTAIKNFLKLEYFNEERIKRSERLEEKTQTKVYCSCDSLVSRGLDLLSWNCYTCKDISNDNVTCIRSTNGILMDLSDFPQFDKLRRVVLDNNNIVSIEELMNCSETLTELSLSNNHLIDISCLSSAINLEIMNLDYNGITCLPASVFKSLARLQVLSIANNNIDSLESLSLATNLMELFASNNNISNLREIFFLKKLNYLTILDLHGNPISRDESHYRLFAIYHLRAIKIFDTVYIEPTELTVAKEMFGGLLTKDFLADQLNTIDFTSIRVLDFPQFSLQTIDLGDASLFSNLVSINLEHNNLSTFSGLTHLSNLKTLCLNYNHIEGLLMRMKGRKSAHSEMPSHQYSDGAKGVILPSLEVLHLGYNGIRDLSALHLHLLPSLRALFLQGNEITLMSGLAGCTKLEELVVDRNRIRFVNESSFLGLVNLSELHLEENRLRSLSNFACLSNLRRLFLGMNHLQEICDIEKLAPLMKLIEISLAQNNLAKRNTHKLVLLHHLPGLQVIDGSYISDNDRNRAEIYFFEQAQFNPSSLFHNSSDNSSNLVATGLNQTKHSKPAGNQFIEAHENNTNENFDE